MVQQLHITSEMPEIIIREGEALPAKEPSIVHIVGNIDAPLRWIVKRKEQIDAQQAHIIVCRENKTILLRIEEKNFYQTSIGGALEMDLRFLRFGINTGKYFTAYDLAEFIKMNRNCFENQSVAMELVSALKNLKAKVDKQIESSDNNRGDKRLLIDQAVKSNVPEKFNLSIPLFKGQPKVVFQCEAYFNVNDLTFTIVSPQANDIINDSVDAIINEQISSIQEAHPEVVIIEQ